MALYKLPNNLTLSLHTVINNEMAMQQLTNLIPNLDGLKSAGTNIALLAEHGYPTNMMYYNHPVISGIGELQNESLILFSQLGTLSYIFTSDYSTSINPTIYKVGSFAAVNEDFTKETNIVIIDRKILLFKLGETAPYEITHDNRRTLTGVIPLALTMPSGITSIPKFTSAVSYKDRLFFYEEGSNDLFYTEPLAYNGTVKKYPIGNIFGAKGTLVTLMTAGFTGGSGVSAYLIAAFDSGDLLVFEGITPDDTTQWKVITKISLNCIVYNQWKAVGTTAYLLTSRGVVDIMQIIQNNSIDEQSILTSSLYTIFSEEDYWKDFSIEVFRDYLILYKVDYDVIYMLNLLTNTFNSLLIPAILSTLDNNYTFSPFNQVISYMFSCNDRLYCVVKISEDNDDNKESYLTLKLFDNEKRRNLNFNQQDTLLQTSWTSLGTPYKKRINQLILLVKSNAEATGTVSIGVDFRMDSLFINKIPFNDVGKEVRWSDISGKPWSNAKQLLWSGRVNNNYIPVVIDTVVEGRYFSLLLDIQLRRLYNFYINEIYIDYEIIDD